MHHMKARFVSFEDVAARFSGRTVAIVGSAPSVLDNEPGFIDSQQIVVRVNNYRLSEQAGNRTDVHYSFYGKSIKANAATLKRDGVKLCLCKCPNSKPVASEWHERNGKQIGIDFRWIYQMRADWWFCETFIPDDARFLRSFEMLDRHVPTTGFSAILDVLACEPRRVFLTGYDFFTSGLHNVNEKWRKGNPEDPIGHRPELEAAWLAQNFARYPITFDRKLTEMIERWRVASRIAATEAAV